MKATSTATIHARSRRLATPKKQPSLWFTAPIILITTGFSIGCLLFLEPEVSLLHPWNLYFLFGSLAAASSTAFFLAGTVHAGQNKTRLNTSSELRFVSAPDLPWLMLFAIAFMTCVAGAALISVEWPLSSFNTFFGVLVYSVMFLGGIVGVYGQAQLIRFPRSLALDPTGVSRRAAGRQPRSGRGTPFSLTWHELRKVALLPRRKSFPAQLMLVTRDGEILAFVREDLGGDIREIAEIVEFFRAIPRMREQLSNPVAALDLAATTSPSLQRSWQQERAR